MSITPLKELPLSHNSDPVESTIAIAQDIQATDGNSAYDAACKRILSEKRILAWIMQTCLEEYQGYNVEEIEKYIEGQPQVGTEPVFPDEGEPVIQGMDTEDKSVREGTVTYDIRFFAVVPSTGDRIRLIINIEAQNKFNPGYPLLKRAIYYCCRMISSQHGREFSHSHYEKIKKVYSIWVCLHPPKNQRNTITCYQMTEKNLVGNVKEPISDYDLLSVVMICLGGPEGEHYEGILKLLNTLLSNGISETEKRKVLQNEFDIPMTRELESEVSTMCNLSQSVEEKGRQEERLLLLKNLIKNMPMPIEQALATLEIPKADWQKYHKLLAD